VPTSSFGELLRHWRHRSGLSQLDLALEAGVSQRHLSFLESGRSQPTQSMVLGLAEVMALPLREQNTLLTAAGFPALHTAHDLSDPALAAVRQAIDMLLQQQEPYPAMVVNRYWNLTNVAEFSIYNL
jgi:transcriptional regulator with XRE-family HTH domain